MARERRTTQLDIMPPRPGHSYRRFGNGWFRITTGHVFTRRHDRKWLPPLTKTPSQADERVRCCGLVKGGKESDGVARPVLSLKSQSVKIIFGPAVDGRTSRLPRDVPVADPGILWHWCPLKLFGETRDGNLLLMTVVRLFSRPFWFQHDQLYSAVGSDIVMESITVGDCLARAPPQYDVAVAGRRTTLQLWRQFKVRACSWQNVL